MENIEFVKLTALQTFELVELEVMAQDLGNMSYKSIESEIQKIGNGWRLPTMNEIIIIFKNKDNLGLEQNWNYWTSDNDIDENWWSGSFNKQYGLGIKCKPKKPEESEEIISNARLVRSVLNSSLPKDRILLQRYMDNGNGLVSCIQSQEFSIDQIHNYFSKSLQNVNHDFNFDEPFEDLDAVVAFLDENWLETLYEGSIITDLKETESRNEFLKTCNSNGFGNVVDKLVLIYNGKILFQTE